MYREKIMKCPLYPIWVCLIATDSEDEVNKRHKIGMEGYGAGYAARDSIQLRGEKDKAICVFLIMNPTFNDGGDLKFGPGVIAHECVHGSSFILEFVGIHASHRNDEAQAYLTQYLVEESHKFYKPWLKQ